MEGITEYMPNETLPSKSQSFDHKKYANNLKEKDNEDCLETIEMFNSVRNKDTGVLYDIREEAATLILDTENQKLTKLTGAAGTNAWEEWWDKKFTNDECLFSAVKKGKLEEIENLLDESKYGDLTADLDAKGLDEFTPLHCSVIESQFKVAEYLLKLGANVNSVSSELRTPLHLACEKGYKDFIELLLNYKANINAQDIDGNTPLHKLSSGGHEEALK